MSVETIAPMLATLGKLPSKAMEDQFAFEMKWDGVRVISYMDGRSVTAMSRNGIDVTQRYPELAELNGHDCVLDGEIVAFDEAGRVSFGTLQHRMHVDPRSGIPPISIAYLVFDVLVMAGKKTLSLSYAERRELLFELSLDSPHVHVPDHFLGSATVAFDTSEALGAEGIVAKKLTSKYTPGIRSPYWIKIKHTNMQEVVIGGWRPGSGQRRHVIGSLLLGIPTDKGLQYVGHVGTGFTRVMLEDLTSRLIPLETARSPFSQPLAAKDANDAHWVEPVIVGEVEFAQWTRDGILRIPSWRGLRPDKSPHQVEGPGPDR